jgi:hypothetical protein
MFLAASSALAQQPPQPASDPATASIEGTVLNAVTGEPIRKAEVNLNGVATPGGPQANLIAATDASGHFAFRALPGGNYWLGAQHPGYGPSASPDSRMALEAGDHKSGVEIRLAPQGAISGKVTDEFGAPVASCSIGAIETQSAAARPRLFNRGGAQTNDEGEYWIQGLEKGRYYVSARCFGELEAPHALMPARDHRKPTLVYASQFYPGVPDVNGATRLRVTPGTETQGIDFQMRRVSGVTVRVRVDVADPALLSENVQVQLLPPSLDPTEATAFGAGRDRNTGEFQIRAVTPGSYVLVASTFGNGPLNQSRLPIQIGATPPALIHMALAPAPQISGTLEVEGDDPPALDSLTVALEPLGNFPFQRPQPARVSKDGTFTLVGVNPGRWRLVVAGVAYVKSLSIGAKDVSPYGFDVAQGTAGPIHILASNKTGQVQVTVSAASTEGAADLLLVPTDMERLEGGLVRGGGGSRGVQQTIGGVVPGRYRLIALDRDPGWVMAQLPEVLKALEGHSEVVDVGEGQTVQATVELTESDRLKDAIAEAQ